MAKGVLISLLVIGIGLAWLLNTLHFIGGVDWLWTGLLAISGVIALAWGQLNKLSFVAGVFLVVASVFSLLRQTGVISLEVEVPILTMVFGVVLLLAQLPMLPHAKVVQQMKEEAAKGSPLR